MFKRDDWSDTEKNDATDSGEKVRVCKGKGSGGRPGTAAAREVVDAPSDRVLSDMEDATGAFSSWRALRSLS